jgi:hypothetical protein
MPRPTRRPKKFNEAPQTEGEVVQSVVPAEEFIAAPAVADTVPAEIEEGDFPDEFGFSRVKGVKKLVHEEETHPELESTNQFVDEEEEEDNLSTRVLPAVSSAPPSDELTSDSSPPAITVQPTKPVKPAKALRTSDLLPLLPTRRTHLPSHKQKPKSRGKKSVDLDSEDVQSPVKVKSSKKKRIVVEDKENKEPEVVENEIDSEEEVEREERRKLVRKKFHEVDEWQMAFETVDVSFSSQ